MGTWDGKNTSDETAKTDAPAVDDQKTAGSDQAAKDTTPAEPETAAADSSGAAPENVPDPNPSDASGTVTTPESTRTQDAGVQTGGLTYVDGGVDDDGLPVRKYPEQGKVDAVEKPAEDAKSE